MSLFVNAAAKIERKQIRAAEIPKNTCNHQQKDSSYTRL